MGLKSDILDKKVATTVDEHLENIAALREGLVTAWVAATGFRPEKSVMITQTLEDGRAACWIVPTEVIPLAAANEKLLAIRKILSEGPGTDSLKTAISKVLDPAVVE